MRMGMRNWLPLIVAAGLGALALSWRAGATGAAGAGAPQTTVAVVNLEQVLQTLSEVEEHRLRLTGERDALRTQLRTKGERLQTLEGDLKELPQESDIYREKLLEALQLQASLEAEGGFHERWLEIEQMRILKEMFTKIEQAVGDVAARDGWDVVLWDHSDNMSLDLSPAPPAPRIERFEQMNRRVLGRGVAYASIRADITQQVIDTMNNAYAAGR